MAVAIDGDNRDALEHGFDRRFQFLSARHNADQVLPAIDHAAAHFSDTLHRQFIGNRGVFGLID